MGYECGTWSTKRAVSSAGVTGSRSARRRGENLPTFRDPSMTCEIGNCPICNDKSGDYTEGEVILLKCKICGDYKIAQEDLEDIDSIISPEEKYLVSGFTRSLTIKKSKPPVLTRENLKDIAERAPKSVLDKIDHLLLNLSEMSSHPGETLKIKMMSL